MAHSIGDFCISCGACAAACPAKAISKGEKKYVIDPKKCVDCSNCARICPVKAPRKG